MNEKIFKTPIFFYGEGASERRYIQDILMKKRYPQHIDSTVFDLQPLVPHNGENSPVQLLGYAIESCDKNPLAECWCVFDGDGDHHNWKAFWKKYDALEDDVKGRIRLVFQNSCWELWLVLHIQDVTEPLTEPQLIKILADSLEFKGYSKGCVDFPILQNKDINKKALNLAFKRSKALQGESSAIEHLKLYTEPVTTMNELVAWFRENFPNFIAETTA
jgi:hypothetical protein